MFDSNKIREIESSTVQRYNDRLSKLGFVPQALGWGSREHQIIRFDSICRFVNFSGKTVLDIGCGFSDFYKFLLDVGENVAEYTGIDINENFINECKQKYKDNHYEVRNIMLKPYEGYAADIGVIIGVLNFKFKDADNFEFSKEFIKKSFNACKEALVVNLLSSYLVPNYPKEDMVYYHSPEELFEFAQELTDNVSIIHDFPPIPQKEFNLILRR